MFQHGVSAPVVAVLLEIWTGTPQTPAVFAGFTSPRTLIYQEPLSGGIRFPDLNILNEEENRRIRELNEDGVLCGTQAISKRWRSCINKHGDYIEGLKYCILFKINTYLFGANRALHLGHHLYVQNSQRGDTSKRTISKILVFIHRLLWKIDEGSNDVVILNQNVLCAM